MKTLAELFAHLQPAGELDEGLAAQRVGDLHLDSRALQENDVFIAIQGGQKHGLDFLAQAGRQGASVILTDRPLTETEQAGYATLPSAPLVWVVTDLQTRLAALANWFYDAPSRRLKVVGITGTNGKTSTAHYLAQSLAVLGQTPALIGTLGHGLMRASGETRLSDTQNTTPDVVSVQRLLHDFAKAGANWVVMEVSSHALRLGRVAGVAFECVALTQVTRDHLDFHADEADYRDAKRSLFSDYESRFRVLNACDSLGQQLLANCPQALAYSVQPCHEACGCGRGVNLCCQSATLDVTGMHLALQFAEAPCEVRLNLMGRFNLENVLCALGILMACRFDWAAACAVLPALKAVKGRMHKVAERPTVLVDFAHTPDALQNVLQAVKAHFPAESSGRLWVVFGCGGDRDRGKRPLMAAVAEALADKVVLTSDNPRHESPQQIFNDTLAGFADVDQVIVIEDRHAAIEYALQHAVVDDVVVIAGKGHEAYQEIAGVRHSFSDQQVVEAWFAARS
ncbi:UDP-N-acetylmuramoyl-L-alanyl-D-glutamate--2,6-diaminopimelate ligase [Thiomicrorhabdus cannonii]|uniref:UDP-N-acetylmuramoyl-L-alanyl-D-glutamate--2, 6-diaminopimelate ligase n=1 Tax=Thiomicrorhabdus cannonii TaxID=2748011 RepID=UPI0015B9FFEC|nr:UDP-N-acetylmuramoyl-L-alanyl-D-glutamate--2,6-diaminopimelate ligase [Thiomicrorhabdus cannonii]